MSKRVESERFWMRMGVQDDYHDFDDPWDAAFDLGSMLAAMGVDERALYPVGGLRWREYGVSFYIFEGDNYVSSFWGDADARPTRDMTQEDKDEFVDGLTDGFDESS